MRITIDLSNKEFSKLMKARMNPVDTDPELLRINEELAIECQALTECVNDLKAELETYKAKPRKPVYIPLSSSYELTDVVDSVEIYNYDRVISGHTYIAWYGDNYSENITCKSKEQLAKLVNNRVNNKG